MQRKHNMQNNQDWLFEAMKSLEFKPMLTGVCFGVCLMAMQAILGEDIAIFEARLMEILRFANGEILDALVLADLKAFFNGVELFQQPNKYKAFFGVTGTLHQTGVCSLILALCAKLEKDGGVYEADRFSGAYTLDELTNYFSSLNDALKDEQNPLAFVLRSYTHTISVTYDAKKNEWLMLDINNAPFKRFKNYRDLAKAVHGTLTKSDTAVISTAVFSANKHQATTTATLNKWKSNAAFQSANKINSAKTNATDSNGDNLLHLATMQHDVAAVSNLIAQGANVNVCRKSDGASPVYIAAFVGDATLTALLLVKGADKDVVCSDDGTSPLFVAAMQGYNDVVTALLKHDANPDLQRTKDGATALYVAACNNHVDTVSLLLAQGANANIARKTDNLTPLAVAAWKGHTDMVKKMLTSGEQIDLNVRLSTNGETPLMLAAKSGHKEIVKQLLVAGASTQLKSNDKLNAAELALRAGHKDIAELIKMRSGFFSTMKSKLISIKSQHTSVPVLA